MACFPHLEPTRAHASLWGGLPSRFATRELRAPRAARTSYLPSNRAWPVGGWWPSVRPTSLVCSYALLVVVVVARTEDVTDWPWGLGACSPVLVPSDIRYVSSSTDNQGTFAKKNRVRGLPAPPVPGGPPVLGPLVRSAEGLPSTRNWPFRWPLSPTSPPQVIPKAQGNASRQLAGAVVWGGGAAPAPPLAGSGRSCASSIRVA
jgi:hypothetical protein